MISKLSKIIFAAFCIIVSSCHHGQNKKNDLNKNDNESTAKNNNWRNKEFHLDDSLILLNENDNVRVQKKKFTIIAYYDGNCSMCYFELVKWKKIKNSFKTEKNCVEFKFILWGNSKAVIKSNLEDINFPLENVFFDPHNAFKNNYGFLLDKSYKYSSMLVNEKNSILLVGNPTLSNLEKVQFQELINCN